MNRYMWLGCLFALALLVNVPAAADQNRSLAWRNQPSPLVELVRQATVRFADVNVAVAEGYAPFLGCASSRDRGAMGIHYVSGAFLGDGTLDAARPEALLYEPTPRGGLRLVGVEYLTFAEAWDPAHEAAPVLNGHVLHYTGAPNRYRIPAHYELHVWAWKHNPSGTFADWNPRVSCDAYEPS